MNCHNWHIQFLKSYVILLITTTFLPMFYPLNTILINKEEYITLPTSSEDNRHGAIKRFHFDNDWVASVAQHTGVNGGDMELFSVALMNSDGKVFTSPNDPTSRWQDIKENLTYDEVEQLIEEIKFYDDCYFI